MTASITVKFQLVVKAEKAVEKTNYEKVCAELKKEHEACFKQIIRFRRN